MADETVLLRCEGTTDRMIPASMLGGWPLPNRLAHFPISDAWVVPTPENEDLLDPEIVTFYRKVSESQLTDEQIVGASHLMRGAQYEKEVA